MHVYLKYHSVSKNTKKFELKTLTVSFIKPDLFNDDILNLDGFFSWDRLH